MGRKTDQVYRIQEFATLTGVTVRALHHYDRLELLKPTGRSRAGYRLYRASDRTRLEQILVLKYLGLPLTRIGRVLRQEVGLQDALSGQQQILTGKRRRLGLALETLGEIEQSLSAGGRPDWAAFAAAAKDAEDDRQTELRWRKKFSDETLKKLRDRRQTWTMTLQDYELARDVRAAIARNESPSSPAGQALAARWRDTTERFTGGDEEMKQAVFSMVADWGQFNTAPLAAQFRAFFLEAMKQAS